MMSSRFSHGGSGVRSTSDVSQWAHEGIAILCCKTLMRVPVFLTGEAEARSEDRVPHPRRR